MLNRSMQRANAVMLNFSARGVGHTRLIREGLLHYEGEVLLVGVTQKHADILAREIMAENPKIKITPYGLDHPPVRGSRAPCVYDHAALAALCTGLSMEVGELKERLARKINELRGEL